MLKFIESPQVQIFCSLLVMVFAAFELYLGSSDFILMMILIAYCITDINKELVIISKARGENHE